MSMRSGGRRISAVLVVLSEEPVPTTNGIRAKARCLLEELTARMTVDLVIYTEDADEVAVERALRQHVPDVHSVRVVSKSCGGRARRLARGLLGPEVKYTREHAAHDVLTVARRVRPDVIHLDAFPLGVIAGDLRRVFPDVPIVWSVNDSYSLAIRSRRPRPSTMARRALWGPQVARIERAVSRHVTWVDVVSRFEAEHLHRVGIGNVRLLPLGRRIGPHELPSRDRDPSQVVIVSNFGGEHGHYVDRFVREGWPVVAARCPDARLRLVGVGAGRRLQQAVQARTDVELVGWVDDVHGALAHASLAVVPQQRQAGVPTKALDALQVGTPVVGGRCLWGLTSEHEDRAFAVATDFVSMGEAVAALLGDKGRRQFMSDQAIEMMSQWPAWPQVADAYLRLDEADPLGLMAKQPCRSRLP